MKRLVIWGTPVFTAAVAVLLKFSWRRVSQLIPQCTFRRYMGAYCPGCGGTRAVGALLEGNLAKAFYYNAGLCILGIICILLYAEYALGIKILPRKGIIWAVFGIIMFLYYVLRNFFIAI